MFKTTFTSFNFYWKVFVCKVQTNAQCIHVRINLCLGFGGQCKGVRRSRINTHGCVVDSCVVHSELFKMRKPSAPVQHKLLMKQSFHTSHWTDMSLKWSSELRMSHSHFVASTPRVSSFHPNQPCVFRVPSLPLLFHLFPLTLVLIQQKLKAFVLFFIPHNKIS